MVEGAVAARERHNDFLAYASACHGEVLGGERDPIALFPQPDQKDLSHVRFEGGPWVTWKNWLIPANHKREVVPAECRVR